MPLPNLFAEGGMIHDFGVVILFIILTALFVGGVTYVAVTDPVAFSLTPEQGAQK
jgi:hypothetical protein